MVNSIYVNVIYILFSGRRPVLPVLANNSIDEEVTQGNLEEKDEVEKIDKLKDGSEEKEEKVTEPNDIK